MDKKSLKLLYYLKKSTTISVQEAIKLIGEKRTAIDTIRQMVNDGYIKGELGITISQGKPKTADVSPYRLSPKGREFLENRNKERFVKWYPLFLSTVAIILSIIAILISLTQ